MKNIETTVRMETKRSSFRSRLCAPLLGVGLALGAAGAQAADVYWSLGVQPAPGVVLGASNVAPVYVAPAPVVAYPAPVVVYPAPRFVAPPVYGAAWVPPGHFRHRHHRRHENDDRWWGRAGRDFDGEDWHGRRHGHGKD